VASFSDDFNREDAGTLGADWDDGPFTFGIVSNHAEQANVGQNGVARYLPEDMTDGLVTAYDPTGLFWAGAAARVQTDGRSCYRAFNQPDSTGIILACRTYDGEYHDDPLVQLPGIISPTPVSIGIQCAETTISLWVDGVLIGSAEDAVHASGKAGISLAAYGAQIDSFGFVASVNVEVVMTPATIGLLTSPRPPVERTQVRHIWLVDPVGGGRCVLRNAR